MEELSGRQCLILFILKAQGQRCLKQPVRLTMFEIKVQNVTFLMLCVTLCYV